MKALKAQSVDCVITDPMYDCDLNLKELRRVCRGNIIVFCAPENQFFKPDEFMFWAKPISTKNYSKHVGRFCFGETTYFEVVDELMCLTFGRLH